LVDLPSSDHAPDEALSNWDYRRGFMEDIEANVPRSRKSAVRRVRRLAGKRLTFMLGAEDDTLREFAEDSKTGRAAKTLVKDGPLRITLVALKKGTVLPPHHVDGPISIQTIRGCLRLTTERGDMDLSEGSLIALGPGVVHAAKAHEDCAILLTFAVP
jgi:quercetin dioxygenase-like cupin family protein